MTAPSASLITVCAVLANVALVRPEIGPAWAPGLTLAEEHREWLRVVKSEEWSDSTPLSQPPTPMYVPCSVCHGAGEVFIGRSPPGDP